MSLHFAVNLGQVCSNMQYSAEFSRVYQFDTIKKAAVISTEEITFPSKIRMVNLNYLNTRHNVILVGRAMCEKINPLCFAFR